MKGNAYSQYWELMRDVLRDCISRGDVRPTNHAVERMIERSISREDIETILLKSLPSEMYKPFEYPHGEHPFGNEDPVFTVVGNVEERLCAVALAIKQTRQGIRFSIVTVMNAEGRHKK